MTTLKVLRGSSSPRPAALCALLTAAALALVAAPAQAAVTIESFNQVFASPQAGAHADESTSFHLEAMFDSGGAARSHGGEAAQVVVKLPPGVSGDPQNVARCPRALFSNSALSSSGGPAGCPADTMVGTATLVAAVNGVQTVPFTVGVFNVQPGPGEPAELGVQGVYGPAPITVPIHVSASAADNYALTATVLQVPREPYNSSLLASSLTLWGAPAAHQRCDGESITFVGEAAHCEEATPPAPPSQWKPFMRNPTDCSTTPITTLRINTYEEPEVFTTATASSPNPTGCATVPFNPRIQLTPDTTKADDPTGLTFDLSLPQNNEPGSQGTSDLKKAVAKLPPGMTMSPTAADGLGGCTPAQVGIGNDNPANCPDNSKIGTAEVDSPILPQGEGGTEGALTGSVYVGKPENGLNSAPPYTIYVDLQGYGLEVKLKGTVAPDPQTGQITTVFDDNPELPFDHFILHFKGGPRAPLVTPSTCGRQTITTEMTPYSDPQNPVTPPSSFTTTYDGNGAPCPATRPFQPTVSAGTENPLAGQTSPFHIHLSQPDGNQPIESITINPPPGFSAYLKGVPFCPEAAIAAATNRSGQAEQADPSCSAASKLGIVTAAAGAGEDPLYVNGNVYLAGPYKGAPLSAVAITPAVAGPFDLGNVVVRSALYVNPSTAQLTIKTDPIPHILGGVPLQLRSIDINVDRPNFSLNPTNCNKMSIATAVDSIYGTEASIANPFQVGGCASLAFKPKIAFKLKGGTRRSDHPAFTSILNAQPGEANIARAQVSLPHSEFLDQAHIQTVCTRVQFAEGTTPGEKCPAASVYGYAKAITPLLEKPAEGPVYLRSSSNKLPDLVAALDGEIDVALDGRVDTDKAEGIRTTFEVVPDAPVSEFTLSLDGGHKGLLINSTNLCAKPNFADAKFTGQNGKTTELHPVMQVSCGGKGKKHKRHHRAMR